MMLGRFLELSLAAPDVQASVEFYTKLGFTQAQVGGAWPHAYAVVTDGRITLGLHAEADWTSWRSLSSGPTCSRRSRPWMSLGVRLGVRRLGAMCSTRSGWLDPVGTSGYGWSRRARSRRAERNPLDLPRCGFFGEIALPCEDREISKAYWEFLGFVGIEEDDPLPHVSCTSDHVDLGLYAAGGAEARVAALRSRRPPGGARAARGGRHHRTRRAARARSLAQCARHGAGGYPDPVDRDRTALSCPRGHARSAPGCRGRSRPRLSG